jgi:hypothetical protein
MVPERNPHVDETTGVSFSLVQQFPCSVCRQLLFFENSKCLRCGTEVGYLPEAAQVVALQAVGFRFERVDGLPGSYRHCSNRGVARCNWMISDDDRVDRCQSCRLTSVRPNDTELNSLEAFADAEAAKRRLLHQLMALGLPVVDRSDDVVRGVAFELLSARGRNVITGHDSGVITLDLSESDDAHREFVRQQLGEPYRTVLGHLRHEIAHYYWPSLIEQNGHVTEFRRMFGDERESYDEALVRYYAQVDADWSGSHVSKYATMHPWEDWAETFAHYLHIHAGLATAESIGLAVGEPAQSAGRQAWTTRDHITIGEMVQLWLGLTLALNAMSRSIGQPDLYPFVISPGVVEKLDFVHRCIRAAVES